MGTRVHLVEWSQALEVMIKKERIRQPWHGKSPFAIAAVKIDSEAAPQSERGRFGG